MESLLTISRPEEIEICTNFLHDCRFEKDKIKFDANLATLEIPFFRYETEEKEFKSNYILFKSYRVPLLKYLLKVFNVDSHEIHEGTQRGPGPDDFFNTILYKPSDKQLWISTLISKGILISIQNLNIQIISTREIIKYKTKIFIGSFQISTWD